MRRVHLSFATALGLSGIVLAVLLLNVVPDAGYGSQPASTVQRRDEPPVAVVTDNRRVYRQSVVPGGVYSEAEAQAAAEGDEVVRAHYRSVNLQHLRAVVLNRPIDRYVSFRKDGKIYWTSRRVRIPAGEVLLADSDSLIRARCGNRLADSPQSPTVPNHVAEPPDSELSTIDEIDAPAYLPSRQPVLPTVQVARAGGAGAPQALAPLAAAGTTAAAAGVMNQDDVFYPGSGVAGAGSPDRGANPQSATEASTLTQPQAPAEVPRFEGPTAAPVDPTLVVWGGFPSYVPPDNPVTSPGNPQGGNPSQGGSSSLGGSTPGGAGGDTGHQQPQVPPTAVRPPFSSPYDPSSGSVVSEKPVPPPSIAISASGLVSGGNASVSLTAFEHGVPEPGTLSVCLAGLAAMAVARRRRR